MNLRLHRFIATTRAEGPGLRACIWVQGCPIHCPGCMQPQTWPETGGQLVEISELAERIISTPAIEGVTFMGGEPFAQAEPLAELASIVRRHELSIITFTGYTLEELKLANNSDWDKLLDMTDVLIDGPYKHELQDFSRPWVGSSNQRYHFLTDLYCHIEHRLNMFPNRLEVTISADGIVQVNGMGTPKQINALRDCVEKTPLL